MKTSQPMIATEENGGPIRIKVDIFRQSDGLYRMESRVWRDADTQWLSVVSMVPFKKIGQSTKRLIDDAWVQLQKESADKA